MAHRADGEFLNLDEYLGKRVSEETVRAIWDAGAEASPKATWACPPGWLDDFTADIKRIDVPTLILHGTADRILPIDGQGRRLHAALPDAHYVEIEGGPHVKCVTHAAEVNRELLAFLREPDRGLRRGLGRTSTRPSSTGRPRAGRPGPRRGDLDAAVPVRAGPAGARKVLDDLQAAPVDKLPVDEEWVTVPAAVGDVRVRIVRPRDAAGGRCPSIVYMHGGGWILGNAGTHDRLVRELAVGARAAVAFVEYPNSPEARYPVAIEQGYATAQWVIREGASQGPGREPHGRRRRVGRRQHGRRAGAHGQAARRRARSCRRRCTTR